MERRREEFKGFSGEAFTGFDAGRSHVCENPNCNICGVREVHNIEVERVEEGWIFRAGGKEYGPVRDVLALDPMDIVKALDVRPEDAIAARLHASTAEVERPLSLDDLAGILETTIKRDRENKVITFLNMLSAYLDEPFNISFRAESSTGKSYIPLEIAQLFPEEDVIEIAYASPTAFYHDTGKWDEDAQAIIIDLSHKILIFLDQPHDQLLERLRPLLSHDRRELIYKITDKREKAGLRTKTVKILGFPAVIFCTGRLRIEDQEATRMILLSPEVSQEKIREAIYLRALREGDRRRFSEWVENDPRRKALRERIKRIKAAGIRDVRIPDPEKIAERFMESKQILKPRHARDIARIIDIIKARALLNLFHRKRDGDVIEASEEDVEEAFRLYEKISTAQELGVPPYVLRVYEEVILPGAKASQKGGLTRREIMALYLQKFGRPLPEHILRRELVPALAAAGLVIEEPDPDFRQRKLIKPVELQASSFTPPSSLQDFRQQGGVNHDKALITPPSSLDSCRQQGGVEGESEYFKPGSGLCEFCGEEAAERYAVRTRWGTRFLCRKCAGEVEA
ncbi:MAG: hypothetical protein QW692_04645 [Nitrososphaerota archaeon]